MFDKDAWRLMAVAHLLVISALAAGAASFLSWVNGTSEAGSILIGGAAFGGTATLLLGLIQFIAKK
ncbi:hypothetical protein CS0771_60890 [Catellatospora sp. IY07-71]|uniref:hypothetical protein n=1 Tax=Catellatospora sp. IY07-71 TaxID=2728827 RepID=UPI001BB383E6|nr:hypothetical protein [Catellatospora sp. IY07-71]BCJ76545.1 hypothetical protein CS0771_60890 [Catellatospora sp. IY07-71]